MSRCSISSSSSRRSVARKATASFGRPASMTAPWTTSARMRLECFAALPPRRITALPVLRHKAGGVDGHIRAAPRRRRPRRRAARGPCAGRSRWRAASRRRPARPGRAARRWPGTLATMSRTRSSSSRSRSISASASLFGARQAHVFVVLAEDLGRPSLERFGDGLERGVLAPARKSGEFARRALRRPADLLDAHASSSPTRTRQSRCTTSSSSCGSSSRTSAERMPRTRRTSRALIVTSPRATRRHPVPRRPRCRRRRRRRGRRPRRPATGCRRRR